MAKANTGFNKKLDLSNELADFMGKDTATRAEVVKALWKYIKKEGLQGTEDGDRRNIYPDDVLGELLGNKKLTMFQMTKNINKHFSK